MGIMHGINMVTDGLVFYIDSANRSCIAPSKRTNPLTDDGVKDLMQNISPINVDNSTDAPGTSYTPYWASTNLDSDITFYSNGRGSSGDYDYGFLDLGTPVDGVTKFGLTDCYTVDIWWRQLAIDSDYIYQQGHILGHRDVITEYASMSNRVYVYGSFNIEFQGNISGTDSYYFVWNCGQKSFSSGTNNFNSYYANSFSTTALTDGGDFPWRHHCCVFDLGDSLGSGSKIYTYTNGSLKNSASVTTDGSATWKTNTTNGGNIYIGASDRNGTDETIKKNGARGDMGPFKIYNRALTAAEVNQNFVAVKWRYGL